MTGLREAVGSLTTPGFQGEGPALIEEYGSTTLVWPGDSFEIGTLGEIRIRCGKG